uniref:CSON011907 protein n=1 Tax=Culicoides sonorensis TaxID=179676 RepID=A0A336KUU9_CULSO
MLELEQTNIDLALESTIFLDAKIEKTIMSVRKITINPKKLEELRQTKRKEIVETLTKSRDNI